MTDRVSASALREGEPPVDLDLEPIKARLEAAADALDSIDKEAFDDAVDVLVSKDVPALVAEVSRLWAALAERDAHVCKTCNGRGWVMEYHSIDYGGGLGAGGASNSPCPEYKPPAVGLSAAPKEPK